MIGCGVESGSSDRSVKVFLVGAHSLATILERIAQGDESAVDECVREYGGLVWRLGCRYLDHAQGEIEDAVQDVFIEIWLYAKRFDSSKGSEASFIATLAHRRLIDRQRRVSARRKNVRHYTRELEDRSAAVGRRDSDTSYAQNDDLHARFNRKELEDGFNALPEDERNALWLSVYRGLSHRDISEATNVPIGTVKSRLRRAMLRLTKAISSKSAAQMTEGRES